MITFWEELRTASEQVADSERDAFDAKLARNNLIRKGWHDKVSVIEMGRVAGLTRGQIYNIVSGRGDTR